MEKRKEIGENEGSQHVPLQHMGCFVCLFVCFKITTMPDCDKNVQWLKYFFLPNFHTVSVLSMILICFNLIYFIFYHFF